MKAHLHIERLILEELRLEAAIESEFARLLDGRKVVVDSGAGVRFAAPAIPCQLDAAAHRLKTRMEK